jgi:hypothetical protein
MSDMGEQESKSERRVSGDEFAQTLRQYLPAVAVERLGSVEDQRDTEGVPESGAAGSVESVLAELGIDYTPFERWGDQFLAAMNLASVEPFEDVFAKIPRPPDEPPALWERLLLKAHTPGPAGVSACLLLHTLACARTVRVLK